jgi:DNA-binding NtrC family response regulator
VSRFQDDDVLRLVRAAAQADPARVLDALIEVARAERGFLVAREGRDFVVLTARHMDHEEVRRARDKVSRTVLERALSEGRPVLASDADIAASASLQEQKVRSVCALPLRSCGGVAYLDHRFEAGLFRDLEYLARFADQLDQALRDARELEELRSRDRARFDDLVGASAPMQDLYRVLDRVAASPYPVLVCGESGTGKELVARAIHRRSPRVKGPFVAANCAALPEPLVDAELFGHQKGAFTGADRDRPGLFEQAHGGTLFLDEVACLSREAQESFLRVLETGEVRRVGATKTEKVEVRVVAATNEDLERAEGFRKDLFYRLNVLKLDVPALRERKDDLPLLAEHFLAATARETGRPPRRLSKAALGALLEHRWPGNVRELQNALRRAAALSDAEVLEAADFGFLRERAPGPPGAEAIVSLDDYVKDVLLRWGPRMEIQEIADRLGISRKTLWEKKKKLGL